MNDNTILVFEKSVKVENLSITYQVVKNDGILEGNSYTFYDIMIEKISSNSVERNVCVHLTTDIEIAKKICNILCDNFVLPENLFECVEECLELVL